MKQFKIIFSEGVYEKMGKKKSKKKTKLEYSDREKNKVSDEENAESNNNIPLVFIKVVEKKKYAKEILKGELYMKESGYFRKIEDGFRGDVNDGKVPIDIKDMQMALEDPETGERLELNDGITSQISNFTMGFSGDDKVPICCMFLLETGIMDEVKPGHFRMKPEYVSELRKFGKYMAVISYEEMYRKIKKYNSKKHRKKVIGCGKVCYTDIMSKYSVEDYLEGDRYSNDYSQFFVKDNAYQYQNEWRMILVGKGSKVKKDKDHRRIKLGKFRYGGIMKTDSIMDNDVILGDSDE